MAEGGGECDLQNLQTLCSPCHAEKTAHDRRTGWTAKAASGTADIRQWATAGAGGSAKKARTSSEVLPSRMTQAGGSPASVVELLNVRQEDTARPTVATADVEVTIQEPGPLGIGIEPPSENDTKLAQKMGQHQSFIAVFPQECMGQIASYGTT